MTPVELQTSDGHLVVTGRVPPFMTPAEVILWGSRVFKLFEETEQRIVYRETFAVYLVDADPLG